MWRVAASLALDLETEPLQACTPGNAVGGIAPKATPALPSCVSLLGQRPETTIRDQVAGMSGHPTLESALYGPDIRDVDRSQLA